jgi:hypothetical protein
MTKIRFRCLRTWWMRQHTYSRLWPFCQDCRWAQQAWAKGEFYSHDEPLWSMMESLANSEPVEIVELPSGPNLMYVNGKFLPAAQTYATSVTIWAR